MAENIGICVSTQNNLHHVIGLATAAKKAGKQVEIFFTGDGVELTQNPRFSELIYIDRGYQGKELPGLVDKDFVTQARNAEMVEECDRYVML
jgi:predicted peroxiredoxin